MKELMIEMTPNAEQQQAQSSSHVSLEEFCGNIRRLESQGQDGIALFNEVISVLLGQDDDLALPQPHAA